MQPDVSVRTHASWYVEGGQHAFILHQLHATLVLAGEKNMPCLGLEQGCNRVASAEWVVCGQSEVGAHPLKP